MYNVLLRAVPASGRWCPDSCTTGEWWRVLTSGFLHIGPIHLLFNMMALWVLGRDLETVLGRGRFLALYLVSLLGGAAAVMLFYAPDEPVAGASGAVFGLMGGLVVVLRTAAGARRPGDRADRGQRADQLR